MMGATGADGARNRLGGSHCANCGAERRQGPERCPHCGAAPFHDGSSSPADVTSPAAGHGIWLRWLFVAAVLIALLFLIAWIF